TLSPGIPVANEPSSWSNGPVHSESKPSATPSPSLSWPSLQAQGVLPHSTSIAPSSPGSMVTKPPPVPGAGSLEAASDMPPPVASLVAPSSGEEDSEPGPSPLLLLPSEGWAITGPGPSAGSEPASDPG